MSSGSKLISLTRVTVRLVVQQTRAAVPTSGATTSLRQASLAVAQPESAKAAPTRLLQSAYR